MKSKKLLIVSSFLLISIANSVVPTFYSQFGQDKYIFENFFKNKKNGIFFDIGAYDGIEYSNTYFFEKNLNWTGICAEPATYLFEQLKQNRRCICTNKCIWNKTGKARFLEVKYTNGNNHGYSGLVSTYDKRHKQQLSKYDTVNKIVEVDCIKFSEICKLHNIKRIDLLSIDTEGSELDIIKSINFNDIYIYVITVENNFKEPYIKSFLTKKGFRFVTRLGVDDVYVNTKIKK